MATNFDDAILSSNGFSPTKVDTPLDKRSRIESISEVPNIPNPYVGMIFYVSSEDKYYRVKSLKSKVVGGITVQNAQVNEYVPFETGGSGTSSYSDLSNKPSIGGVTLEGNKTLDSLGIASKQSVAEKQDAIRQVNVTVNDSTGIPSGSASVSGSTLNIDLENIKGPKGDKGDTAEVTNITVGTVTPSDSTDEASATMSGEAPNLVLNLVLPRGRQGNSGVSGDTSEIAVINDLNGGESEVGSIKVLAAEQGKVLKEMIDSTYLKSLQTIPVYYNEKPEDGVITNYYINSNGNFQALSGNNTKYWKVESGDVLMVRGGQTSSYAAWAFFTDIPTSDSTPQSYKAWASSTDNYVVAPISGYVAVGAYESTAKAFFGDVTFSNKIDELQDHLLQYNQVAETGIITDYYINKNGTFTALSGNNTKYWSVNQGDKLVVKGGQSSTYAAWAFFEDVPTTSNTPKYYKAWTSAEDNYVTSPINGYVAVGAYQSTAKMELGTYGSLDNFCTNEKVDEVYEILSKDYFVNEQEDGIIENYYINSSGKFQSQSWQNTKYWSVKKGECICIIGGSSSVYAAWALYEEIPTTDSIPYSYKAWSKSSDNLLISPIDGYIAVGGYMSSETMYKGKTKGTLKIFSSYKGKTIIYIGDSISTKDNYKWKGYLENNYGLKYARDLDGELAPANGGITIMPRTDDDSVANEQKSIWYRCANKRMSIYDFDMISLFGATNDMTNQSLIIGTVDDIAYVDDTEGITSIDSNCTSTKPESLSLASALKGCILMLKRDFPNKEIILPTVMPCGSNYGNWTDESTGLKASEAIAFLQLRIAEKYGLKAIPFYWDMRTTENAAYNWADQWGVHPNMQGALRMQAIMAQTLCL